MANTLVGLFDDRSSAEGAVQDLLNAGIGRDQISVIANDDSGQTQTRSIDEHGNMAAEGAAKGATSGAVVGGIAGLLIGAGFTVLPFAGLLLAGPIAGLLTGAMAGAATGGILGGLIGLGIPKEHAEVYAEGVRRGGTLVTVQTDDANTDRVRQILDRDGAVDIEERGAYYRANGFTGYDENAKPYTTEQALAERTTYNAPTTSASLDTTRTTTPTDKIEVVEEQLAVGKREVERGGVRVRSFVTEKPVTEQVTLHEEHVNVERHPVDRPVSAADNLFRETSMELRETAEVPVVAKEARVVEEVSLNKTASERTETIQDTVRRTDVAVENIGTTTDYDTQWRNHFTSSGYQGSYEEYAPAYQFGQSLDGDWDTNEATYRTRWEQTHPGTWDRFRDAIRHSSTTARTGSTNRANLY
jgi:uncharacterized protein (TIGR02271 family)